MVDKLGVKMCSRVLWPFQRDCGFVANENE